MPSSVIKLGLIASFIAATLTCSAQKVKDLTANPSKSILTATKQHRQIYSMSCIPSSVELVLKYNGKVDTGFYKFQNEWQNKSDGTFKNFDGKTISGLKFRMQYNLPRNDQFPMDQLFNTIDAELKAGRKVIISLTSDMGWHMYVIDSKKEDGDYIAYSRSYNNPEVLWLGNVKQIVKSMKGTDIMTYTIVN